MKTLDELFAEMRFNIESDLIELAKEFPQTPTCPSQSLRALRALEAVEEEIKSNPKGTLLGRRLLFRYQEQLRDFLAVHRAVELLDRANLTNP